MNEGLGLARGSDGSVGAFVRSGTTAVPVGASRDWTVLLAGFLRGELQATGEVVSADGLTWLPPAVETARIIAVAQNYPAHAAEAGGASPSTPVIFFKPLSAFVGSGADIVLPAVSSAYDYEGEVAVVIDRTYQRVSATEVDISALGYTLGNDGSARDLQPTILADKPMVDWFSAKSIDQGSVLGPAVVRGSDLPDITALRFRTVLNEDVVQDDVLASMNIGIAELVSFVSHRMTLRVGDVVLTGTPSGVGKARGRYLAPGDRIVVTADGIGKLANTVVSQV